MKDIIKKNQLMITALAIMIAIAAYLQFAGKGNKEETFEVEDEIAANAEPMNEADDSLYGYDEFADILSLDSDESILQENYLDESMVIDEVAQATPQEGEIPGEAIFTSADGALILSDAKLLKEQTRAKNKDTLLEIINSADLSAEQKQEAVNNMVHMTDIAEKETAAEILLEAKGFSDVIVSMNGTGCDVVVNALELSDADRAQIEDIVSRKTLVEPQNIIISTLTE